MVLGQKKLYFLAVIAVLAIGTFLRFLHFSDWLHFELDQSRDAKVVGLALEQGIGNLPLLGPKAAGSFLRLGPLFYYTEYLSGFIFGNNPAGLAVISLIFSCLTPFLFYLFIRRCFDRKISLLLLMLFSGSLFLIMYSRFAWNPNNLPFFILLFLYSLLRAVDSDEQRKGWWLILGAVAFSFASQLHFVALLSLPVIGGVFLILKRPKISWNFWLASFLVLLFFYVPPIVNDVKTGGENVAEFQKLFVKKTTSDKTEHTLMEKAIRGVEETSLGYFILYSGYPKAQLPQLRENGTLKLDVICDKDCRANLPMGIISGLVLLFGTLIFVFNLFFRREVFHNDFLILFGLWFGVTLGLFVPIAYDLAPRFFLLVAPIPFILLGFIFNFLEKRKLIVLAYILVGILLLSNGLEIQKRFSEMARASQENFKIESDKILKERDRVTLEQQLKITDYMENIFKQNKFPVYVNSEAFYRRAFLYHLEQRKILRDDFRNTNKNVFRNGNYFLIYPADNSPQEIAAKYLDRYFIAEFKNFGTLVVVRLVPKPEAINATEQVFGPEKKPTSAKGVPVRCRWNEVWGECNQDGLEAEDEMSVN
jgi:hypothetical protein